MPMKPIGRRSENVPLREVDVAIEVHHDPGEDAYPALRRAIGFTEMVASGCELVGGLAILLAIVGVLLSGSWPLPQWESLVVCGVLAIFGLGGIFTAWRLHVSASLIDLQINLASDTKRAAESVEGVAGRLELQLRAIAASSTRTAEAVEALAGSMRRPPATH